MAATTKGNSALIFSYAGHSQWNQYLETMEGLVETPNNQEVSSPPTTTTTTTTRIHRDIGTAALKGFILWVGIQCIWIVLMVAWHWDSGAPYGSTVIEGSHANDAPTVLPLVGMEDTPPKKPQEIVYVDHPTSQYLDTVLHLLDDHARVQKELKHTQRLLVDGQSRLQQFSVQFQQQQAEFSAADGENDWSSFSSSLSSSSSSSIQFQEKVTHLARLLSTPALHSLDKTALQNTFSRAMESLQTLLSSDANNGLMSSSVDWEEHVHAVFSGPYPPKEPSLVTPNCSSSEENAAVATPKDMDPNAALQQDVEVRLHKFKILLERRQTGAALSSSVLPNTMMELERVMNTRLLETTHQVVEDRQAQLDASCMDEDQVMDMVDAGLTALATGKDVREVLKQKVLDYDDSEQAQQLILDLALPLPKPPALPSSLSSSTTTTSSGRPTTVNLRQVLNTELISHQAIGWVDDLVSLMEGHDDRLDRLIDSLTLGQPDGVSPGKLFMTKLLKHAGKVNVPHPETLIDTMESSTYLKRFKDYWDKQ
jgi:hypothetical protein